MNLLKNHLPVDIDHDQKSVETLFSNDFDSDHHLVVYAIFSLDDYDNIIVDIPLNKNDDDDFHYDYCFYYPLNS